MGKGETLMVQITITNAGGTLTCDAIKHNERQTCKTAIRNIPNRPKGSFVDEGTWTLKNRVLRMDIRLSDAQKTTLKAIFDASATVTITMLVTNGYQWVYTAWLQRKPIVYSYSRDESGNIKEWGTSLEFVVSTYSYALTP